MSHAERFANVDFSAAVVVPWSAALAASLDPTFKCARSEFSYWWRKGRIRRECEAHVGRCWIIHHDNYLAGYITLLSDRLSVRRRLLAGEEIGYRTFPAVKIGLLAADRRARGAGTRLVEWAIVYVAAELSRSVGVRFMTVDALYDPDTGYDTSAYYRDKFNFELARPNARPPLTRSYREMFLDIKPLIDMMHGGTG